MTAASKAPTTGRMRPAVSRDTAFFWDAAAEHRLVFQQCRDCGTVRHPPSPICRSCRSMEWLPRESAGRGRVHSYTVVHHPPAPGFVDGPAIVAIIEMDEGIRFVSNLIDVAPERVAISAEVQVTFVDQFEGFTVPQFRLVS